MKFGLAASTSSYSDEEHSKSANVQGESSVNRVVVVEEDEDSDAPVPLERLSSRPIKKAPFRKRPQPHRMTSPIASTSTSTSTSNSISTSSFLKSPIKSTTISNELPNSKEGTIPKLSTKVIRTVVPPSIKSRKGKLVHLGFDSSSDDDDDDEGEEEGTYRRGGDDAESSEDEFDVNDEDDEDSEEDQWPVGPIGSVGIGGWRNNSSTTRKRGGTSDQLSSPDSLKAYGSTDVFQIWDDKSKATSWATANRSFHLSLARSFSTSPTSPMHRKGQQSNSIPTEISSIESRLSSLALQATAEKTALLNSFQVRNTALWDSIEASIRVAEKEEGDRRKILEENRRRREEAERKAKEMRENEERRKKEEEERSKKAQLEEEKRLVEEKKKLEEEESKRQKEQEERDRKSKVIAPPSGKGVEGSPQAEWERWTAVMTHIKTNVLPIVSQNPTYRKECFTAKRAITPKIGQLTNSAEVTLRVINQIDQILLKMKAPPGGPTEPYLWTLNHLSKTLVKQAETEVTAKISTAYPLGRVVVGLILRGHVELGEVLMARLVKKCFWITGWWPAKSPGQTEEAHQKALGHASPSAGESLLQYATRMSGLIALYAAILQTPPTSPPQGPPLGSSPPTVEQLATIPPPFRIAAGWRWIVLILRIPLVGLQPTPQLLGSFLEIAGGRLLEVYGKQFGKILRVLLEEGIREKKAGFSEESVSSIVRLTLWLEEWEQKGRIESGNGRVPDP